MTRFLNHKLGAVYSIPSVLLILSKKVTRIMNKYFHPSGSDSYLQEFTMLQLP